MPSLAYWVQYNYLRNVFPTQYSLQISKGCISLAPLVQSSVSQIRLQSSKNCPLLLLVQFLSNISNHPRKIQAIVKEMRSSGITYTAFSLPCMVATAIRGMPSSTACAVVSQLHKIHATIHGMRFSGTACAAHSLPSTVIILRVFGLFVISLRTVYIYLKSAFLPH